jgi:hypothetical protein
MSTTQVSTEAVPGLNQPVSTAQPETTALQPRKPASRLAVRTGIRAGALEDLDDQVAAWWNNLTSSFPGSDTATTPAA